MHTHMCALRMNEWAEREGGGQPLWVNERERGRRGLHIMYVYIRVEEGEEERYKTGGVDQRKGGRKRLTETQRNK